MDFCQSLFDDVAKTRDSHARLKAGELMIYRKAKNNRVTISKADAQALKQYSRVNVERNTYTGEIYLVFNNVTGWPIFTANTAPYVLNHQNELVWVLLHTLGVPDDYEGNTLCNIKRSLIDNVYILKK